ncbi:MAG: tetratricopeptide repeat protein [Desulfobacterales bacterium]
MRKSQILWSACALLFMACATNNGDVRKREVAYRDLGKQYYLAGDFTSALKYLLEAEKMNPDDHILQNYLGQVYLAKTKPELAVAHFKQALVLKPDYAVAKNNLGVAYLNEQRYDEAIDVFKEVSGDLLYATPHYPLTNTGYAYYMKKDYPEAERYYQKALELESGFPLALRGLGRTYLAQGKGAAAQAALTAAIDKDPTSAEAYYDLGESYLLLQNPAKAKGAFQKAVQLKPESPEGKAAQRQLMTLQNIP